MPKYYADVCICISKDSTQRGTEVVGIYDNLKAICSKLINIRAFVGIYDNLSHLLKIDQYKSCCRHIRQFESFAQN